MGNFKIKDSKGLPSWNLTLSIPAIILGIAWFILGGIDLTLPGGIHIITSTKSGADFALFVGPFLAAINTRKWLNQVDAQAAKRKSK